METSGLLRLVEILGRETELLESLHEVLKLQQQGLVNCDVQMISDNVSRQIEILRQIEAIEVERSKIVALTDRDDQEGVKLETLIASAPDHISKKLSALRDSLKQVVSEIRKVNEQNQVLIRQSVSYVQRMLAEIAGEENPCGYGADGKVGLRMREMVIDRKV